MFARVARWVTAERFMTIMVTAFVVASLFTMTVVVRVSGQTNRLTKEAQASQARQLVLIEANRKTLELLTSFTISASDAHGRIATQLRAATRCPSRPC